MLEVEAYSLFEIVFQWFVRADLIRSNAGDQIITIKQ